jgi:plastocyanin
MKAIKKTAIIAMAGLILFLACGCTVSNGVFTGMSQQSSDTSLSASYISFDGSLARQVSLKAGDTVSFSFEGGEGLQAAVKQDGEVLCEIADGTTFEAPADGRYAFTVEGIAKNGAFTLTWKAE